MPQPSPPCVRQPQQREKERPEIHESAVGIGALDAGDTLRAVAPENELLQQLSDALDAETPVDGRGPFFELIGELAKTHLGRFLEVTGCARLAHARR